MSGKPGMPEMATTKNPHGDDEKRKEKKKKGLRLNDDALSAWKDVQDDSSPNNYGVWELKANSKKVVQCLMTGVGGLPQALSFVDDTKLQWIGFRVSAVDEIASADGGDAKLSIRPRFVIVTWLGPQMPPIQRAKFRESGSIIMKQFYNTVQSFYALDRGQISVKAVTDKLKNLGSCTRYDWENKELMGSLNIPVDVPPPVDPMVALKEAAAARLAKKNAKQAKLAAERAAKEKAAAEAKAKADAAEAAKKAQEEAAAAAEAERHAAEQQAAEEKADAERMHRIAEAKAKAEAAAAAKAKAEAEAAARRHAEEEAAAKRAADAAKAEEARRKKESEEAQAAAHAVAEAKAKAAATASRHAAEQAKLDKARMAISAAKALGNVTDSQEAHAASARVAAKLGTKVKASSVALGDVHDEARQEHKWTSGEAYMLAQEELAECRQTLKRCSPKDTVPLRGVFQLWVHQANDLVNKDKSFFHRNDMDDTYFQCVFWDGIDKDPVVRSSVVRMDSQDPTWNSDGRFIFQVKDGWDMEFQVKLFDEVKSSEDPFLGQTHVLKLRQLLRDCNDCRGTDPYRTFQAPQERIRLTQIEKGNITVSWRWMPHGEDDYVSARIDFREAKAAVARARAQLVEAGENPDDYTLSAETEKAIKARAAVEANKIHAAAEEKRSMTWQDREKRKLLKSLNLKAKRDGTLGVDTGGMVKVTMTNSHVWGLNFGHKDWDTLNVTSVAEGTQGAEQGIGASWRLHMFGGHELESFEELVQIKGMQVEPYELTFSLPTGLRFDRRMWPGVAVSVGGQHAEDAVLQCTADDVREGEHPVCIRSDKVYEASNGLGAISAFSVTFRHLSDGPITVGLCKLVADANTPVGHDENGWAFHSDGYFMHNGDRWDVDGVGPVTDGSTLTVIIDQVNNRLVFDLWSFNANVTTVEPWPIEDSGTRFDEMALVPAFTMSKKGQMVFVCEPHDPKNPEHRHR